MRNIIIGLFMALSCAASGQTKYYYVAASVDTVIQDSVTVSDRLDLIDSIYTRYTDNYVTIAISDTLLDDFQTLVLNNHRANWTYTASQDCDYYVFVPNSEETFSDLHPADTSDQATFDKAIEAAIINYSDWTQIYLKLPR